MIEALLSIPLVVMVIAGMIEVGGMMYQFSQTAKAMQIAARLAIVSTPAVADMSALTADYPTEADGDPVPTTPVTVVCGAGAAPCDAAALARIYDGGDGVCGATGSLTDLVGVCDVAPFITDSGNLRISYTRSGLGYVGRPRGPVVTVRVEVRNLTFDMFILDDLVRYFSPSSSFGAFSIPTQPVAMTSEDLSSCRGVCP
ncbi:TadE family protein [Thalassovita aquimarina]|uniref:Pilus assembly protein n=1 Tax=Thalassovita aquimarina TaxID=2785917 RepID=A0ABS5HN43_9RHOB|nr:TadE family protein [Thalassovita aquimarina]MBR9650361.1 pilus assembly protein [Thalassovita aquimarina]